MFLSSTGNKNKNNNNLSLPILFAFTFDVGSMGLFGFILMLVLGGFSSTNVDFIFAAVAKSFPPPNKNKF